MICFTIQLINITPRLRDEFNEKFGDDLKINEDQHNLKFLGMKIILDHNNASVHVSGELYFNKLCDDNADLIQGK